MSKENDPKIKHIQKFREIKETINNVETLIAFSPFFKALGVDFSGVESLKNISELKQEALDLISMPDKFNSLFAERGWIAYENLNADVPREAIKIAEEESINEAEKYLANHYDEKTLEVQFMSMRAIEAFEQRNSLLEKAKDDYLERRYYAVVPIVLACLDGIVNDVAKKNRGFFAKDIELELEAWNSISAHSEGLGKLVKVLQTSRKKTTTDKITIPFRHGILHGRDLNFDNKVIAAKSWAALFSIRDWALAIKHNRQPEKEDDFSWKDLKNQIQKNKETKEALDEWKPRDKSIIKKILNKESLRYKPGTPEFKVAEFMDAWNDKNYGAIYDVLPVNIKNLINRSKKAGQLRRKFENHQLIDFEILEIDEFAPASCKVKVSVEFEYNGTSYNNELTYQLLYQNKDGDPSISRIQKGQWGFTPTIRY